MHRSLHVGLLAKCLGAVSLGLSAALNVTVLLCDDAKIASRMCPDEAVELPLDTKSVPLL